ncbi:histidine kinase [uncultured Algoriphagus sp.]|uniref:histidine kinase n=1 Tax=uncultured Algoriphagus sp. TaxID=417365 RepID=UPI0030EB6D8F|tara:strand:- start:21001 stop:21768 length:768 start_codon:yes stop_codon:yes gene_type:complete
MESRFIQSFFISNGELLIPLDLLLIIGVACFIKLPKEKRADIQYWLPFLILVFTVFYQNFGAYTNYNYEFKKSVNAYLGNTEYPKFNIWVYNIAENQIGVILYLVLIKSWLATSKKKYINWMIYIYIPIVCVITFLGIEPLYFNQPILFTIGANLILIGSGLYFIGLISQEDYLASNPLKLISFWQMTLIMFTFTLTYIFWVSLLYLYSVNPVLGKALQQMGNVILITNLAVLTLTVASPLLPGIFEKEPTYGFK